MQRKSEELGHNRLLGKTSQGGDPCIDHSSCSSSFTLVPTQRLCVSVVRLTEPQRNQTGNPFAVMRLVRSRLTSLPPLETHVREIASRRYNRTTEPRLEVKKQKSWRICTTQQPQSAKSETTPFSQEFKSWPNVDRCVNLPLCPKQ